MTLRKDLGIPVVRLMRGRPSNVGSSFVGQTCIQWPGNSNELSRQLRKGGYTDLSRHSDSRYSQEVVGDLEH